MTEKYKYFFYYLSFEILFEASISEFGYIFGMIFLKDNIPYYFFLTAFLGGLWSYRLHYLYKAMNDISDKKTDTEICGYFDKNIFGTRGHKHRRYLSIPFLVATLIFCYLLYI